MARGLSFKSCHSPRVTVISSELEADGMIVVEEAEPTSKPGGKPEAGCGQGDFEAVGRKPH